MVAEGVRGAGFRPGFGTRGVVLNAAFAGVRGVGTDIRGLTGAGLRGAAL